MNQSDQAGLDDDELPFYELSLDDIFALVDGGGGGGGGDYAFDEFLDVFAEDEPIVQQSPPPTAPIPIGPIDAGQPPPGLGQVPIPPLLPAPVPQEYEDLLREAERIALSALENPGCASLFGNLPPGVTPAGLLTDLYLGYDITFGYSSDPNNNANTSEVTHRVVTGASGQPIFQAISTPGVPHIEINSNALSAFISGSYPDTGLSPLQNRAVTLIHELGHAANILYGPFGGAVSQLDTPTTNPIFASINRLNSARIRRRCF